MPTAGRQQRQQVGVAFARTQNGKLYAVAITGNAFTGSASSGITIGNIRDVTIGNNAGDGVTSMLTFTGGAINNLMLDGSIPFTTAGRPAAWSFQA